MAVREGRTVATRNILTDSTLWLAPARRADIEREGFKATAAAPLAAKDRILGALVVHYWTERTFGSEEIAALEFLAKQAAIAIRNASLYEAEHAEAARIRALTAVNRRISSALELDALLRTISESAAELTGARLATFWLADEPAPHAVVHQRLRARDDRIVLAADHHLRAGRRRLGRPPPRAAGGATTCSPTSGS